MCDLMNLLLYGEVFRVIFIRIFYWFLFLNSFFNVLEKVIVVILVILVGDIDLGT